MLGQLHCAKAKVSVGRGSCPSFLNDLSMSSCLIVSSCLCSVAGVSVFKVLHPALSSSQALPLIFLSFPWIPLKTVLLGAHSDDPGWSPHVHSLALITDAKYHLFL